MKNIKIYYRIFLSVFTAIILFSVYNYIFNFEATLTDLQILRYPSHLIHPLVIAQVLGLIIIITNKIKWLVEWAYAGFFFNLVFAIIAHMATAHGNGAAAAICLLLLCTTYILGRRLNNTSDIELQEGF